MGNRRQVAMGTGAGLALGQGLALGLVLLMLARPVRANETARDRFAVTTSLSSLTQPIYALQVEVPWHSGLTAALRVGAGKHTTTRLDAVGTVEGDLVALWYPGGDFRRGVQLGATLGYAQNWTSGLDAEGSGHRTRAALLVGLKWTGVHGFVGEVHSGLGVRSVAGETHNQAEARTYADTTLDPRFDVSFGLGF